MSTEPEATPEGLDDLGAVWDKMTAEPITEEVVEATPEAEEVVEAPAEDASEPEVEEVAEAEPEAAVEPPSHLPARIKEHWGKLSPEQRDAIDATQREMSNRMAELGRVSQAAKPVYDVLLEAAKTLPSLRDMTPAQIARDALKMATVQDDLARDPVNTIARIAKEYGALDGLRAALTGAAPAEGAQQSQALMTKIRDLEARLANVADPQAIEERVMAALTAREAETTVKTFAATAPHWGAVEAIMPQFVQIAQQRLGESASAKDVLDAAYDMATHAIPDLRTKVEAPAPKAQAAADPARTAAQVKAKSVNVVSKTTGAPKPLTEQQRMAAVWDKYHTA